MTSPETIRTALTRLWDTGANAYELAQAVMQAADIESADLELEVESVISRALLAREFADISKVAAEVAKLLPGDGVAEAVRLPLCEGILMEIMTLLQKTYSGSERASALTEAYAIIRKHFAALSVEEVASRIETAAGHASGLIYATVSAQAVMQLLRKE